MPCYFPVPVFRAAVLNESGKRAMITNPVKSIRSTAKQFRPCGCCEGCRLDKANDWTTRLVLESKLHQHKWFITFTYDDVHVPVSYSASKREVQLLNMRIQEFYGRGVRYHVVSDYSPISGGSPHPFRPHYHGGYFGFAIDDLKKWSMSNGYQTFTSERFCKLWPFGHHLIGSLTAESMGYVARHNMDRVLGPKADEHYYRQSPVDGQFYRVETEFALMSRRPGIGGLFYERFKGDIFPCDDVVIDGRKRPVPRYFRDRLSKELDAKHGPPEPGLRGLSKRLDVILKRKRVAASMQPGQVANRTPDRLHVRHQVQLERLKRLKRTL